MAIVLIGGKQYLVNQGDKISVNKLSRKEGDLFEVKDELSKDIVKLKVLKNYKGEKIDVLKYIKKKGYKRVYGSRAYLTELEVVG